MTHNHYDQEPSSLEHLSLGFGGLSATSGDHIIHLYSRRPDCLEIQLPFVREGLIAGHKCVFLSPSGDAVELEQALAEEGLDPEACKRSGQLVLSPGLGTTDKLRALLAEMIGEVPSKYPFLRWCGEMSWTFSQIATSEVLMEWESACNMVGHAKVVFLCQYDLNRFGGDTVIDALRTHPLAVIGDAIHHSPYYQPPETFLEYLRSRAEGDAVTNA